MYKSSSQRWRSGAASAGRPGAAGQRRAAPMDQAEGQRGRRRVRGRRRQEVTVDVGCWLPAALSRLLTARRVREERACQIRKLSCLLQPNTIITKRSAWPASANADEIRKAYRKLARKYHPDLNPGDKAAEDRFKKVQEAYDVLSDDDKKRQMYDQYGFYSENIPPGGQAAGSGAGQPGMDFGGFDFSELHAAAATGWREHRDRRAGRIGGSFRDIFSQFFGGQRGARQAAPQPESGSDLEYGLNIDFWQAIRGTQVRLNITRQEMCATCHGTGAAGPSVHGLPGVQWHRQRDADGRRDEVQSDLPALRRQAAGCTTPAPPATATDASRSRRRWRFAFRRARSRVAPARGRQGQRRNAWAARRAISTSRSAWKQHPFFHRDGDNIEIQVPVTVSRSRAGREDRSAHHRRPRAARRFRRARRTGRSSACAKRACSIRARTQRGDQIVEVSSAGARGAGRAHPGTAARAGAAAPEDPRQDIWGKVQPAC